MAENHAGFRVYAKTEEFERAMSRARNVANDVSKSIVKSFEARDIGRTLATALGINLEKIAESVARLFTGISAAEEAALTRMADLSAVVADKQIAAMRARLTDEQKLALLTQEREKLEARIADASASKSQDQVKLLEMKSRLLDVERDAAETLGRIEKQRAADTKALIEDRERMAKLEATAMAELGEIARQKAEEQKRAAEEDFDRRKKAVEENREMMILEAKAAKGLTEEEKTRLDVLRLQTKQKLTSAEIDELLVKKLAGALNPAEQQRLQFLIQQNDTLTQQIAKLGGVSDAVKAVTKEVEGTTNAWKDFQIAIGIKGRTNDQLSDRELERKRRTIEGDIADREIAAMTRPAALTFTANDVDWLKTAQQFQLSGVLAELGFRQRVRRDVAAFGEDVAFRNNPGLTEAKLQEIQRGTDEDRQIARETRDLTRQLLDIQKRGAPVVVLNPTRG